MNFESRQKVFGSPKMIVLKKVDEQITLRNLNFKIIESASLLSILIAVHVFLFVTRSRRIKSMFYT